MDVGWFRVLVYVLQPTSCIKRDLNSLLPRQRWIIWLELHSSIFTMCTNPLDMNYIQVNLALLTDFKCFAISSNTCQYNVKCSFLHFANIESLYTKWLPNTNKTNHNYECFPVMLHFILAYTKKTKIWAEEEKEDLTKVFLHSAQHF